MKIKEPLDVWKALQPKSKEGLCPLCGSTGKAFMTHKRGTKKVLFRLVCFSHECLEAYFSSSVEHELVADMIDMSRTFPAKTTNLVIVELDKYAVVT